ncbi:LamG domain-containing protein [Aeoliella sp. ICT_H6.2]|uniref:LamG domain-containing protein n=1 Tax=Aeoliella straminimaris TaxID=2954799 RepID=A0A9X2FEA6_9BACT|nr:LamG domain-containing protein [Aeoliella straminimaris]MCO6047094.1 LamG domain-containing protein [Aeoliella straminimaris]
MLQSFLRLTCLAVAVCLTDHVQAVLVYQYTFNDGVANNGLVFADEATGDSIGNPGLTYVDPTNMGRIVGGQVDLSANNGQGSGADGIGVDAAGIFLDLDDFAFSNAAFGGANGAASIEMWVTVSQNRNWARLWDIGTSEGGAGVSDSGSSTSYVIGVGQSGSGHFGGSTHVSGAEQFVPAPPNPEQPPLPTNVKHHVVFTLDHSATTAERPNGTATLYLNGTMVGQEAIVADLDLNNDILSGGNSELIDNNNWFGRAQWGGDPLFDGLYDEINIYDHALTESEVTANNAQGPVAALIPVVSIDRSTGEVQFTNVTDSALQLTSYTLTSNAGGLDTDNNVTIDGSWTTNTESATELMQTGGAAVTLPANSDGASIGSAWFQSTVEDIQAIGQMSDGTMTALEVVYTGDALSPIDLNADGIVDEDDWFVFAANAYTNISGLTEAQARRVGDLNFDGLQDYDDFRSFKSQFNALAGAGALEAIIGGASVPEPSTLALAGLAAAALLISKRSNLSVYRSKLTVLFAALLSLAIAPSAQAQVIMDWDASAWSGNGEDLGGGWNGDSWIDSAAGIPAFSGGNLAESNNGGVPVKTEGQIGLDPYANWIDFSYESFDVNNTAHPLAGLRDFTIAAVVRVPESAGALAPNVGENQFWLFNGFVGKEIGNAGVGDWVLGLVQQDGDGQAHIAAGTGLAATDVGTLGPAINDDMWHTVHFVVNDLGSNMFEQRLYLDGVEVANDLDLSFGGPVTAVAASDFAIGARRDGGNGYLPDADMARLKFYGASLSPTEIANQASSFLGEGLQPLQMVVGGDNSLSIENPNVSDDINIDAYFITSNTASTFNTSNWTSLEDQGIDTDTGNPDGDFNEDGTVDIADYTVWRNNLGSTNGLPNSAALGGTVDSTYYELWKDNFGATGSGEGLGWTELTGASNDTQLREYFLGEEGSTLAASSSWELGTVYTGSGAETLEFMYSQDGVLRRGVVVMSGAVSSVQVPEPGSVFLALASMATVGIITLRRRPLR